MISRFRQISNFIKENQGKTITAVGITTCLVAFYHLYEVPRREKKLTKKIISTMKKISKKLYPVYSKMALIMTRVVIPNSKKKSEIGSLEDKLELHYQYKYVLFKVREDEITNNGLTLLQIQEWVLTNAKSYKEVVKLTQEEEILKTSAMKGKTPIIFCRELPDFLTENFVLDIILTCSKTILLEHLKTRVELIEGRIENKADRVFELLLNEVEVYEKYLTSLDEFLGWEENDQFEYHPLNYFESAKKEFCVVDSEFKEKILKISKFYSVIIKKVYKCKDLEMAKKLKIEINNFK